MTDAEIIFCPYNYIIDPNIREIVSINEPFVYIKVEILNFFKYNLIYVYVYLLYAVFFFDSVKQ